MTGTRIVVDGAAGSSVGELILQNGTTVSGSQLTIDAGDQLTLNGATITGGTITDNGAIDVTLASTIDGHAALNNGAVTVDAQLTLDNVTVSGTVITDNVSIELDGNVTLQGGAAIQGTSSAARGAITNNGTLEVAGPATLLNDILTNTSASGSIIQIDNGDTLTLSGTAIIGGIVNDSGTIHVTGDSKIGGASLNNGGVTVDGGQTLKLNDVTVTGTTFADPGTIKVESDKTLTLAGTDEIIGGQFAFGGGQARAAAGGVVLSGVSIGSLTPGDPVLTLTISASSGTLAALSLAGLTIVGGLNGISGTLEVSGTLSAINAALASGLTYDPVGTSNTLTMTIDDGSGDTAFRTLAVDTGATPVIHVIDASGAIRIASSGLIDVTGTTTLSSDELFNGSTLQVDANAVLKLAHTGTHGGTITDDGTIEILSHSGINGGSLDIGADGLLLVDGGKLLTLNNTIVTGGTINDHGTIEVMGSSAINGASLNHGGVTIDHGQTLTLDNDTVTGTTITGTDASSIIQIDANTTLQLDGATIDGGTVNDYSTEPSGSIIAGDIDVIGDSTIKNAGLNNGNVAIESGQTLTLDDDTVTGTTFIGTDASSIIQIDGNTTLQLDGATINGGTINDYSTDPSGSIIAGDIDVTGDSTISGASLNNGNVTIESGVILTLDNDTVTGTTFTGTDASSILQIDATTTLKLDGATIDGGAVHDAGTIDVTGASAINGNLTLAGGEIRVEDNATLTLGSALAIGANTVTLAGSHAVLDDFAGLSLAGGTIAGSGHLAADTNLTGYGTVSISLDVADLVTASGGTLEFTNAVDGTSATSFEIAAAANSVLKFDAAVGTAAVHPTVTFEGSDNGLGVLDLTAIALSDFHGVIANFDEGEAIDVHYAASASLDNTGHVLTVFDSLGNSLGTIDFATSYAGDTFNVSSGAITVDDLAITLDSASATEGAAIHVIGVTDEGANVASDVTYSWQTQNNDNQWNEIGSGSSYTPTETDEGHSLRLVTTYAADSSGSESTTVGFGTVQESPTENASIVLSGLTGGNAVEGQQITAVVNEGDAAGVSDITYTFQTSTDNGVTWTPAQSGPGNTYTPTETDEGSQLQVQVSFTDSHGFAETGATSAGTVQESVTGDLVATLDSTSATEGTPINVTGVTDGGLAVASGVTYDWLVSNDNGATWAEANGVNGGSSYTPVAADDGQLLHLTVSLANDPTGTESSIYDLGTVQAAASGQPPVVTTSATINFDDALAGTNGAALDNYLAGYGIT